MENRNNATRKQETDQSTKKRHIPSEKCTAIEKSTTDRRVRRTKDLLLQGLMQLMETKDVRDISVKELSNLADINRGTFYLHYRDIYDMLEQIEDEMFQEFNEILNRDFNCAQNAHSPQETLLDIFSFLERHRDVARIMIGPHGDHSFVNRLKTAVKKYISTLLKEKSSTCEYSYTESFIVSGCTGVIETWLNQDSPGTPKEMSIICNDLLLKGLRLL